MLNKSHETKLSAFGVDFTINRWNRIYYSYPNAILLALREGNPAVFGDSPKTQRANAANTVASTAIGMASNSANIYPFAQNSKAEKDFLDQAAASILSQTAAPQIPQIPFADLAPSGPMPQEELIRNAQQSVEDARNGVVTAPSVSQPVFPQPTVSSSLPLTPEQEQQQQIISYAQQGVEEAHNWLASQPTTTMGPR